MTGNNWVAEAHVLPIIPPGTPNRGISGYVHWVPLGKENGPNGITQGHWYAEFHVKSGTKQGNPICIKNNFSRLIAFTYEGSSLTLNVVTKVSPKYM